MYGLYMSIRVFFVKTAKIKLLNFERDCKVFYQRNLFQFSGFAQNFELNQSGTCL